jgi:hypothetical protein
MAQSSQTIDVYIETGKKRTYVSALEWPGWSRGGRSEAEALQALLDYAPRYSRALGRAKFGFKAPADVSGLNVVERVEGDSSTDYGVPAISPPSDSRPIDEDELKRLQKLLTAYWNAFDAAVRAAAGKELRKGPRGGGRELAKIAEHVLGAERSYLGRLAWKPQPLDEQQDLSAQIERAREEALQALAASVHGELPDKGPRGGALWKPRYFVRRSAWHVLDHMWEIEDRVTER